MDAVAPHLPSERSEGLASDLLGVWNFLIDPAGAATRLSRKWFWITPLVIVSAAWIIYSLVQAPMLQHFLETAPTPPNTDPAAYAKGVQMQMAIQRFVPLFMPVLIGVTCLVNAAILLATSSMLAVRVTFLKLFNLIAGCALITGIQAIAWAVILKMKGEVSSVSELRPPLGLDIFLGENTNKLLLGFLGYFSVFQIWWFVMIVLIYSVGFRVSKGKAVMAILPILLFGLALTMLGAMFQKS